MNKLYTNLKDSLIKDNPIFVSYLALCPTLGTTSTFNNAIGMGLSVLFVLIFSNLLISSVRNFVPSEIRIPVFITIIASLVTLLEMILEAVTPTLYETLGMFLPLIVVNCIILGRAESFASKNNVKKSIIDGLITGLAFAITISIIGAFREFFGTGSISIFSLRLQMFTQEIMPSFLTKNTGAFISLGLMGWVFNEIKINNMKKGKVN